MKKHKLFKWNSMPVIALSLLFSNVGVAGLLMPIFENTTYTYIKHDSAIPQNEWIVQLQGLEQVDLSGQEFVKVAMSNEDGSGSYDEILMRSTENAVYSPDGSIGFQIAPIGTTWNTSKYHDGLGTGINVHEIIAIETVSVPYGTFDNAYVHQVYFDPDNPALSNTPYWYEYIVPNIGWVKQVDYWCSNDGPLVLELSEVTTPSETVQQAYIAYYGRAADPAGHDYWVGQLTANNGDLSAIMDAFGASAEFDDKYGAFCSDELVDQLYVQIFGRTADVDGLVFWVTELLRQHKSIPQIALALLQGASGADSLIIRNKITVAEYYTAKVRSGLLYDSIEISAILGDVNETDRSVSDALAIIDQL